MLFTKRFPDAKPDADADESQEVSFDELYKEQIKDLQSFTQENYIFKSKSGKVVLTLPPLNSTGLFLLRRLGILGRILILRNLNEEILSQEIAEIFKFAVWINYIQTDEQAKAFNKSGIATTDYMESLEDIDKASAFSDAFINLLCKKTGKTFTEIYAEHVNSYIHVLTEELKKKFQGLNLMVLATLNNPKLSQIYITDADKNQMQMQTSEDKKLLTNTEKTTHEAK